MVCWPLRMSLQLNPDCSCITIQPMQTAAMFWPSTSGWAGAQPTGHGSEGLARR